MNVRKLTPTDDWAAIGNIYQRSWQAAYRGIVPQNYLDSLDGSLWTAAFGDHPYTSFVLLDNEKYIGTSAVCAARDETMAGFGEIVSIYLLPEYFGRGCGTPLFQHAAGHLLDEGYSRICLWVLAQNLHAQKFYEKQGFQPNGDRASMTIAGKELEELRYIKCFE